MEYRISEELLNKTSNCLQSASHTWPWRDVYFLIRQLENLPKIEEGNIKSEKIKGKENCRKKSG